MKKAIIEGSAIIVIFFATYFALQQINWMEIFRVEQHTKNLEEKLGDLFWESFSRAEEEITDPDVTNAIDSILAKICRENSIDCDAIKLHILHKDEVNAFALPGGYLVVYSGLIGDCEKQQELAGVLCHEIAHIQLNHVMKKLIKEMGLSTLVSMTAGNNGQIIKETARMLSSSAFDRNLEKEADLKAVEYMVNADIDPGSFADFLYRMADEELKLMKYLSWISTHPESKERAEYIINLSREYEIKNFDMISQVTWTNLKIKVKQELSEP